MVRIASLWFSMQAYTVSDCVLSLLIATLSQHLTDSIKKDIGWFRGTLFMGLAALIWAFLASFPDTLPIFCACGVRHNQTLQESKTSQTARFLWARRDSNPRLLLCDCKVSSSNVSNTSISCVFVWIFAFFRGLNVHCVQYVHCVFFWLQHFCNT